jgi:hypothetical protein
MLLHQGDKPRKVIGCDAERMRAEWCSRLETNQHVSDRPELLSARRTKECLAGVVVGGL